MTFYLGTHEPHWLRNMDIPLFVSRRRLERLVVPPVAFHRWALASGGFTELHKYGGWHMSASEYARRVQMYVDETKYFLKCVKNRKKTVNSLDDGIKTLNIALTMKKSAKNFP